MKFFSQITTDFQSHFYTFWLLNNLLLCLQNGISRLLNYQLRGSIRILYLLFFFKFILSQQRILEFLSFAKNKFCQQNLFQILYFFCFLAYHFFIHFQYKTLRVTFDYSSVYLNRNNAIINKMLQLINAGFHCYRSILHSQPMNYSAQPRT